MQGWAWAFLRAPPSPGDRTLFSQHASKARGSLVRTLPGHSLRGLRRSHVPCRQLCPLTTPKSLHHCPLPRTASTVVQVAEVWPP